MTPTGNTGKVLTRQDITGPGSTTVALTYPKYQAQELRQIADRLVLKRTKRPSLSLLARRSMGLYLDLLNSSPANLERERAALERMVTHIPCPRQKAQARNEALSDLIGLSPGSDAGRTG